MRFRETFTEKINTLVLPFRFKDNVYRALGNRDDFGGQEVQYTWTIFLDEALLENREEVAKCVRAFKREFGKQFPGSRGRSHPGEDCFSPSISGGSSVGANSLELFPGVFYLGSQVRLKDSAGDLQNLDLLIDNCRHLAVLPSLSDGNKTAEGLEKPAYTETAE